MGMATYEEPKREPRIKGATLCPHCGAEYTNKGNWYKGQDISTGTENPRYVNSRKIPIGVCPICEREEQ